MNEIKNNEKAEKISIKAKLDFMDITYSQNAGINRLREQLREATSVPEIPDTPEEVAKAAIGQLELPEGTYGELLTAGQYQSREANKLSRVIISCLNPNKRDWSGEYFDVGNSSDPAKRKYILFDVEYHVPKIILEYIKEKKCQIFIKGLDNKGREIKVSKLIPEYNIVNLLPLTVAELKELSEKQILRDNQEIA